MKRIIAMMIAAVMLLVCGCSSESSSGSHNSAEKESLSADKADFADAESFEAALNRGEYTIGKTVAFKVHSVHPESYFGFNLWAGEHLNFIFEEEQDVQSGDIVTVRVRSIFQSQTGSWIINDPKHTSNSQEPIDFTIEKKVGCVNFCVPEDVVAETEIDGGMNYSTVDVIVMVAKMGNNIEYSDLLDLYEKEAEQFDINGVPAFHRQAFIDTAYMDMVFLDTADGLYTVTCASGVSAELNAMYYEDFIKTVSIDRSAVKPDAGEEKPSKAFESFSVSGTGSKVIRDVTLPPVTCIVRAEHNGRSNFIAHHLSNNGDTSYVANELGVADSYRVLTPRRYSSTDGVLDVKADGSWRITFIPLEEYFTGGERTSFSGSGNSVAGCFTASGMTFLKGTHNGRSNFIVHVYEYSGGDSRLYAFNEIGQYSGDAVIRTQAGKKYFFNVTADGYWTINIDG